MTSLAQSIAAAKRQEDARRLDQGEAEVLARLGELPQPPPLDDDTREDLRPFVAWTTAHGVRHAAAKPFVVRAFIDHLASTGASTAIILRRVNAISALHDRHNLADPVSTTIVREMLSEVLAIEPAPRSWNKDEKASWVQLPPEIKAAIGRREHQREKELRRLQNQVAELRHKTAPESSKTVEPKETTTMAKGEGPYAGGDKDSKVRKDDSGLGYPKPRDISKKVHEAWKIEGGFAGKLPSDE